MIIQPSLQSEVEVCCRVKSPLSSCKCFINAVTQTVHLNEIKQSDISRLHLCFSNIAISLERDLLSVKERSIAGRHHVIDD